jgi:hypothetical protein
MIDQEAKELRRAIENLLNAKLHDALRPDGLGRLIAHRSTGVASFDVRAAERLLDESLAKALTQDRKRDQSQKCATKRMN